MNTVPEASCTPLHVVFTLTITVYLTLWLIVRVVWVELVLAAMAPDGGGGVVLMVYVTFTTGSGVHPMVTVDCSTPWTELSTLTSLGGPDGEDIYAVPFIKI